MVFQHVLQICAAIIASVGGAAVIILAASKFIANTLAERALAKQQHEFEQLNINFQHQLDLATRRVQVELDALGVLHKLRTQSEFETLQSLWQHIASLRVAFHNLPHAGFQLSPADPDKKKELDKRSNADFLKMLFDAQHFVNEKTLSIPKEIANAANELLKAAHLESIEVMLHPDPDNDLALNRREFYDNRAKILKDFETRADALELTIREYLKGQKEQATGE